MASVFRSAATSTARRFSGVIAASLMAASQAVTPIPATARDIDGLPPQCAKAGDELAKLKCGRAVFQGQIADAKARSVDAKARGAAAEKQSGTYRKVSETALSTKACMDDVTKDIQIASKAGPLKPDQVKAFEARIAGCEKT